MWIFINKSRQIFHTTKTSQNIFFSIRLAFLNAKAVDYSSYDLVHWADTAFIIWTELHMNKRVFLKICLFVEGKINVICNIQQSLVSTKTPKTNCRNDYRSREKASLEQQYNLILSIPHSALSTVHKKLKKWHIKTYHNDQRNPWQARKGGHPFRLHTIGDWSCRIRRRKRSRIKAGLGCRLSHLLMIKRMGLS